MTAPESSAPGSHTPPPLVVVMGVAGCGKSLVGKAVAQALGVHFADGDDYHPQSNIDKMSSGTPLDDVDREPWLHTLAGWLVANEDRGGVLGCSALKRSYRDILRSHATQTVFLHLAADRETITARVQNRPGHFMPGSLVDSQFDTLEPLTEDENGVEVDATLPPEQIVEHLRQALRL